MASEPPDEWLIDKLEAQFPAAAGAVFANAYNQALQAGLSVLVSDSGAIYEIFPDGRRRFVKKIAPPTPIQLGLKITFE